MADAISHRLDVRDKAEFLQRMMTELAGDARISLEGDLSRCHFPESLVLSREELGILKRSTTTPLHDYIVLQLKPESVEPILKEVMAAGLKRAIIHVQIQRNSVFELNAYDNFHSQCVITGPGICSSLLAEMKSKNILRDFAAAKTDNG